MAKIKRKRKKRCLIEVEDLLKILNKVQVARKRVRFSTSLREVATTENILKDVELKYKKTVLKTQVNFVVEPPKIDDLSDFEVDVAFMQDKILEGGEMF